MRISPITLPGLAGLTCCLLACGPIDDPNAGRNWTDAGPEPDSGSSPGDDFPEPQPEECSKMDIVFIIDDSASMQEEQDNLTGNFPVFAQVLEEYRTASGQALDFHVAVTTTGRDLRYRLELSPFPIEEQGDNGAFRQSCGMSRPWIERNDGNLDTAFPCVARVGTNGPSYEMPLLAMEWALHERVSDGANDGFLREDALLAVIVLTDEDDCSRSDNDFVVPFFGDACDPENLVDVSHYVSVLDALKGERGRWATAVIAGPTPCSSSLGEADEAVRLKDFVAQTGENAVFSSICEGDLASALGDAIATFDAACQAFPPVE